MKKLLKWSTWSKQRPNLFTALLPLSVALCFPFWWMLLFLIFCLEQITMCEHVLWFNSGMQLSTALLSSGGSGRRTGKVEVWEFRGREKGSLLDKAKAEHTRKPKSSCLSFLLPYFKFYCSGWLWMQWNISLASLDHLCLSPSSSLWAPSSLSGRTEREADVFLTQCDTAKQQLKHQQVIKLFFT